MDELDVIVHRAGNSLDGIRRSFAMTTIPEADVWMTKDKVLLHSHDNIVPSYPSTPVDKLSYEMIFTDKKLDPPLLEDALRLVAHSPIRKLVLDVKDPNAYPYIFDFIKMFKVEKQIIFAAPDHEALMACKKALPNALTSLYTHTIDWDKDNPAIDYYTWVVGPDIDKQKLQSTIELHRSSKKREIAIYCTAWNPTVFKLCYELGVSRYVVEDPMDFYKGFQSDDPPDR